MECLRGPKSPLFSAKKASNFDATSPRNQLRPKLQPFQHLHETPLLQPSILQNQPVQCRHAIHMTIRQLSEHLKSDKLNWKALQLVALTPERFHTSALAHRFFCWRKSRQRPLL